jgi:hypothetical protein
MIGELFTGGLGRGSTPQVKVDTAQPPTAPTTTTATATATLFPALCWTAFLSFDLDKRHGITTGSEAVLQITAIDDGGTPGTGAAKESDDASSTLQHRLVLRFVVEGDTRYWYSGGVELGWVGLGWVGLGWEGVVARKGRGGGHRVVVFFCLFVCLFVCLF